LIHSAPTFAPAAGGPSQYQYAQPFHLPEVATIAGRKVTGTKARVYWLLRLTAEQGFVHAIGQRQGPPGWVPLFLLREPWSGGQQGDRRVRSLREDGVRVDVRFFEGSKCLICSPRTIEAIDGRRVSVEIHLSPVFGSPLAPSGSIGDEAYLAELRGRWATGELVAAFRGASLAGVTAPVDPAWCPLPALARALSALGAEVVFEELG
jgi:hypothetical protein